MYEYLQGSSMWSIHAVSSLFPQLLPTRKGEGVKSQKILLPVSDYVRIYVRRNMCKGRLYICEYWALMSFATFKIFWFYFIDLTIILAYSYISSDTSIYWSFKHLWACGCLKNSLLVWFDYLYLVSYFFLENYIASSEDGVKSHQSSTTTFSEPFCIIEVDSLSSHTLLRGPQRKCGWADKTEN